jgi:hypothetical protein
MGDSGEIILELGMSPHPSATKNWWQAVRRNKKVGGGALHHNKMVSQRWDIINFGGPAVEAVGCHNKVGGSSEK